MNDERANREKRGDALQRFLLTLSDQQLVTGIAVLIAGYSKICSMPIYHFNIVASLAWFSSATHLATLGVLRSYLVAHPVVRNWRVIAMVLLLILLLVAQFPAWSDGDDSLPVSCFFLDMEIPAEFSGLITLITTLGFLVVTFVERIAPLYSLDLDWNITDSSIEMLVKLLLGKGYREPSHQTIARQSTLSGNSTTSTSALIREEREKVRYDRFRYSLENDNSYFKSYLISTFFIAQEMSYAFVSQGTILVFDLALGFAYTIVYRLATPDAGIEGNQNEMGFGQLVPLFLLLLPALAIGEIYFGGCKVRIVVKAFVNTCNRESRSN